MRRFLAAYGPATADDLGRWLGFRVAEPKRMLAALEDELVEVEVGGLAGVAARAPISTR